MLVMTDGETGSYTEGTELWQKLDAGPPGRVYGPLGRPQRPRADDAPDAGLGRGRRRQLPVRGLARPDRPCLRADGHPAPTAHGLHRSRSRRPTRTCRPAASGSPPQPGQVPVIGGDVAISPCSTPRAACTARSASSDASRSAKSVLGTRDRHPAGGHPGGPAHVQGRTRPATRCSRYPSGHLIRPRWQPGSGASRSARAPRRRSARRSTLWATTSTPSAVRRSWSSSPTARRRARGIGRGYPALLAEGLDVQVNIVGFAIDDAELESDIAQWAELGHGSWFQADTRSSWARPSRRRSLLRSGSVTRGAVRRRRHRRGRCRLARAGTVSCRGADRPGGSSTSSSASVRTSRSSWTVRRPDRACPHRHSVRSASAHRPLVTEGRRVTQAATGAQTPTRDAPVLAQHSNAYDIFILVLTVLSLGIMVLMLLPVDPATLDVLRSTTTSSASCSWRTSAST